MTHTWEQMAGVVLAGQYRLEEFLGGNERGAYFRTTFRGERAVAHVMMNEPERLELWQRAAQLNHPNVQRVLNTGRDQDFIYAIFEYPEDSLAAALRNGPLSQAEAREVIKALRDALKYLHGHDLAHGSVEAGSIVAVGATVKLESDALRPLNSVEKTADLEGLRDLSIQLGVPEEASTFTKYRPWIIVGAAVVAVGTIVGLTRHSAAPAPVPVPPPVTYQAPAPRPAAAKPEPVSHPASGNWRVIAYTYSRFPDAAKKAAKINAKHPEFHAEVFTPNGHARGPYLVALGGRVSRAEAERLEKKAKSKGLPRDTFARNYSN